MAKEISKKKKRKSKEKSDASREDKGATENRETKSEKGMYR